MPKMTLLLLALFLLVFATGANTCLTFPLYEDHDHNKDYLFYYQAVNAHACDSPLPPKTGYCLNRDIGAIIARTKGQQYCWNWTGDDWETDWDEWDGGAGISVAHAEGMADMHGYCRYGQLLWWTWSADWYEGSIERHRTYQDVRCISGC